MLTHEIAYGFRLAQARSEELEVLLPLPIVYAILKLRRMVISDGSGSFVYLMPFDR